MHLLAVDFHHNHVHTNPHRLTNNQICKHIANVVTKIDQTDFVND